MPNTKNKKTKDVEDTKHISKDTLLLEIARLGSMMDQASLIEELVDQGIIAIPEDKKEVWDKIQKVLDLNIKMKSIQVQRMQEQYKKQVKDIVKPTSKN